MPEELSQKTPISRLILVIVLTVVLFALGIYIGFMMGLKSVSDSLIVAEVQTTPSVAASISASPTSSPIDTSDLKTYTNDEYGYSFRYPADWEVNEIQTQSDGIVVNILSPLAIESSKNLPAGDTIVDGDNISIYYYNTIEDAYAESKTIDEIINNNSETIVKIGNTQLGGNPAVDAIVNGITSWYTIFSNYNKHLYKITVTGMDKEGVIDNENLINIINSFQFIN